MCVVYEYVNEVVVFVCGYCGIGYYYKGNDFCGKYFYFKGGI